MQSLVNALHELTNSAAHQVDQLERLCAQLQQAYQHAKNALDAAKTLRAIGIRTPEKADSPETF